MKILVIGAGVIGLSCAYFLRQRGYDVAVIDRQDGPGKETSFANGALLTAGMPEPWNAPGCWRVLLGSLGRSDAPLQLRLRAVPGLMGWGIRFLQNSTRACYEKNTVSNLRLALFSLKLMEHLRQQTNLQYGATARGMLKVFRSMAGLDAASTAAERLAAVGLKLRSLSRDETVALEPTLAPIADQLTGAIQYGDDEAGDAYRFCVALTEHLRTRGVEFRFATTASSLDFVPSRVTSVRTDGESFSSYHYVVAAGSYSTPLLRPLGIHLPVYPAKGYSVTFGPLSGTGRLRVPLVDDDMHAAIVPVGDGIRVAGTAEFSGYDVLLRPKRIQNLMSLARRILPAARLDTASARPWCGLRPMSADGVPIIGRTMLPNLWVNTGHGHLGWTMAAGSGALLADLMSGAVPSIDPRPYDPCRFQSSG